jgi:hypothetical protein
LFVSNDFWGIFDSFVIFNEAIIDLGHWELQKGRKWTGASKNDKMKRSIESTTDISAMHSLERHCIYPPVITSRLCDDHQEVPYLRTVGTWHLEEVAMLQTH